MIPMPQDVEYVQLSVFFRGKGCLRREQPDAYAYSPDERNAAGESGVGTAVGDNEVEFDSALASRNLAKAQDVDRNFDARTCGSSTYDGLAGWWSICPCSEANKDVPEPVDYDPLPSGLLPPFPPVITAPSVPYPLTPRRSQRAAVTLGWPDLSAVGGGVPHRHMPPTSPSGGPVLRRRPLHPLGPPQPFRGDPEQRMVPLESGQPPVAAPAYDHVIVRPYVASGEGLPAALRSVSAGPSVSAGHISASAPPERALLQIAPTELPSEFHVGGLVPGGLRDA
jgi:hypothetical protein